MKKVISFIFIFSVFLIICNYYNQKYYPITIESINNKERIYNNKNGIYYFGRPDCLECIKFQNKIKKTKSHKQIILQYVNTAYWKRSDYNFCEFLKQSKIDKVPILIEYKNNIEIKRASDITTFLEQ